MKKCYKCQEEKELVYFAKNSSKKDGLQPECKPCRSIWIKEKYRINSSYYKANSKKNKKMKRLLFREYIDKIKAVPCADCKKEYPPYVMDFDHLRNKEYNISRMSCLSLDKIKNEIDKCEIVCANCHRYRTFFRKKSSH